MKIASFNINSINRRLTNLLDWLRESAPTSCAFRNLKPRTASSQRRQSGRQDMHVVYCGERSWNGVAILARWPPVVTRMDLPGDDSDRQCGYLEAAVNGLLVTSIYAPNGNAQPSPKLDYKLAWLKRLHAHAAELYASGVPVVLPGVMPKAPLIDSWRGFP
jgi:exodeoxyribonuclease III